MIFLEAGLPDRERCQKPLASANEADGKIRLRIDHLIQMKPFGYMIALLLCFQYDQSGYTPVKGVIMPE